MALKLRDDIVSRLLVGGNRIWSLLRAPDLGDASVNRCRRLIMGGRATSYSVQEGVVAVITTGTG